MRRSALLSGVRRCAMQTSYRGLFRAGESDGWPILNFAFSAKSRVGCWRPIRYATGKAATWEGHDFSRAVNPPKTSRAPAPAVATVYFAYIGLLTIASASLSLEVFGERRSVSRSPERFSGLWLFLESFPFVPTFPNSKNCPTQAKIGIEKATADGIWLRFVVRHAAAAGMPID